VRITFDRAKREETLRDRAIDFVDAQHVFAGLTLNVVDRRHDYGEMRVQTIGYLAGAW
jgi:uncharacterized protein